MTRYKGEDYVTPDMETMNMEVDTVLCTSGQLGDYTVDDFDWEGVGNE